MPNLRPGIGAIICYCFCSLCLVLFACQNTEEQAAEDYSDCRYEKPEAIFYDGLPQISDHEFNLRGRGSEESFVLSNSIKISIFQYGCDYRTQEFQFDLGNRASCDEPAACTRQAVQFFQSLSRLGPEYHTFRVWAKAINDVAHEMRFGQAVQLAEGFWVKVDERKKLGSTTLMLTLSEKE